MVRSLLAATDYSGVGFIVVGVLVYLLVVAALYVWLSLATAALFLKLGEPAWKAWVPFVNPLTIFQLGGYSGLWLIALCLPVVQIAALVVFFFAVHTINQRLERGGGYTVLAVFLYPVWATIVGFGGARPIAPPVVAQPSPFESRMANLAPQPQPPYPAQQAAPLPYVPPPAPAPAPAPASALTPPPAPASAPPPYIPPPVPASPPAARPEPWAPPISSIPGVEIVPPRAAVQPSPAPPAAPPALPQSVVSPVAPPPVSPVAPPPVSPDPALDDKTILKRRGPVWTLEPTGAEAIAVTSDVVLLGRNPSASGADVQAQLVAIVDPSKTMSKTHARLRRVDDSWTITDLHSTNGTNVIDESGAETELAEGSTARLTGSFRLGQVTFVLRREG